MAESDRSGRKVSNVLGRNVPWKPLWGTVEANPKGSNIITAPMAYPLVVARAMVPLKVPLPKPLVTTVSMAIT